MFSPATNTWDQFATVTNGSSNAFSYISDRGVAISAVLGPNVGSDRSIILRQVSQDGTTVDSAPIVPPGGVPASLGPVASATYGEVGKKMYIATANTPNLIYVVDMNAAPSVDEWGGATIAMTSIDFGMENGSPRSTGGFHPPAGAGPGASQTTDYVFHDGKTVCAGQRMAVRL